LGRHASPARTEAVSGSPTLIKTVSARRPVTRVKERPGFPNQHASRLCSPEFSCALREFSTSRSEIAIHLLHFPVFHLPSFSHRICFSLNSQPSTINFLKMGA